MKILITPTSFRKPENAEAVKLIESRFDEIVYNDLGVPLNGAQVLSRIDGCDAYIAGLDSIDKDTVQRMPDSLRIISRYGAGVDRVDLTACKERGIAVANTPGVNAIAVCELAFGLMLSVARDIPVLNNAVKRGEWKRAQGMELAGKTLGIVGLGAIGRKIAVRAKAFDMRVLAFDPYWDDAFAAQTGVERASLESLFATADIVTLHLPLNEQTHHIVGREMLSCMKPTAILINTARGGLIDEQAAAEALQSGRLYGVGLDAFETEPPKDSPLISLDRVICTPHTGAHTAEAVSGMGMLAVENVLHFMDGSPFCRVV